MHNCSCLLKAAEGNDSATVLCCLVERRIHITIDAQCPRGRTALIYASKNQNLGMVELLLAHGANPNVATLLGRTALTLAAKHNDLGIATLLLHHGANYFALDKV